VARGSLGVVVLDTLSGCSPRRQRADNTVCVPIDDYRSPAAACKITNNVRVFARRRARRRHEQGAN